jgi:4'-phosphopantetheinyl transferase
MYRQATISLPKNELHVWHYQLKHEDYLHELENPVLSEEEKARCSEFVYEKDKVRYICNHVFRRGVLAQYLGIKPAEVQYCYTDFGKPFFSFGEIQFSHSYRADIGLLAVNYKNETGVDIEQKKQLQDVVTFSDFSFSAAEKELIFANNRFDESMFFTFWTFKEAFIKAIGTGLNADIRQFDLADFMEHETKVLDFGDHTNWTIKKLPAQQGFAAAYAVKGEVDKLIEFNYN